MTAVRSGISARPGYALLADAMAAVCSGHVFGVMGDGNMAALATLDARGDCRYHAARHEAGAVSMASGFARIRGTLGVCTVTHGPGLTNALTALRAAVHDRAPLLLVVGELPAGAEHNLQFVDHRGFAEATGALVRLAAHPGDVAAAVAGAAAEAIASRLPVVLRVSHEATHDTAPEPPPPAPPTAEPGPPAPVDVTDAADMLQRARRPFLLLGRGCVLARAEPRAELLAERAGALLGTTLGAKGASAGSERNVGFVGGLGHPAVGPLVREADLVLALGASLNEYTTGNGATFDAPIVQIDHERAALGRVTPCARYVCGDVSAALDALLPRVRPRSDTWADPGWRERVAACHAWDVEDASDERGLDPRTVVRLLDGVLPPERVVVLDGGHLIEWGARHLTAATPRHWLLALGAGSIGLSTSLALGAAIGSGLPTVVVVGDGSCMMSLGHLDDAVRARAPLCVVVVNDGAYAAEVHKLRRQGLPDRLAYFGHPGIAGVATALGADARVLRTREDLAGLRGADWSGLLADGPVVLDVRVTDHVVSDRLRS